MYSKQEARQELIWRRCCKDVFYFLEKYWKIKHPARGAILMELRDAQAETLRVWLTHDRSIALKARQIGFSTLASGLVFWHIYFHPDRFILTLSKTEREAQKLKEKIDYGHQRIPEWMRQRGPKPRADTLSKLEFDNGSSVEALPATNPARGESAYLIIVDEWAFFENPEAAWSAIEPATDIGGKVILLSTANGTGNLFHSMCVGAMTGTNDFAFIFHSWRAVPERDDAWYATKQRNMLEWQLHQEYPSDPEEAFIKSGNPVFDINLLRLIDTEEPMRGYLSELGFKRAQFMPNADGPLHVWKLPVGGRKYVVGADVAEGLEHGDFSVAHVIDTVTGDVVAKWRGHLEPDLFGSDVLWHLGWFYNYALLGVEVNNHGYTTLVALNTKGYGNLYRRTTYDERTKRQTKKLGWRTQSNTKPLMIDELARAIRFTDEDPSTAEVKLIDSATIGELTTFVRDGDGKMRGSPFDDQVISLAIANQMLKHFSTPAVQQEEHTEYTWDWWLEQANAAEPKDRPWVVGVHNVRG